MRATVKHFERLLRKMADYPALEALGTELNHRVLDGGQQLTVTNEENTVTRVSYNNCDVISSLAECGKISVRPSFLLLSRSITVRTWH